MMVVCLGIAPTKVSRWTSAAAAFAPLPADVCGAELAADGAAEVAEGVGLGDVDVGADTSGVSVGCGVVGADTTGAGADTTGVAGAEMGLMGLTGEVGFVGFDKDFTQEFDEVTHAPHTGCP